ncbi:MAG: hypothetical protein ACRCYE_12675 [Sarcina sp.]
MRKIILICLTTGILFFSVNEVTKSQANAKVQALEKKIETNLIDKNNTKKIWELKVDSNGEKYLKSSSEEIKEVWKYDEQGNIVFISMEEYINIVNNSIDTDELGILFDASKCESFNEKQINKIKETSEDSKYRYIQTDTLQIYGSPIKITPSVSGTDSIVEFIDGNHTNIFAGYGGVALGNARIKNAIGLGTDFEWNYTATSNNNSNKVCEVKANQIAYLEFMPKLTYTTGSVYRDIYNRANIKIKTENLGQAHGVSPNKLSNGYAEGIFSLKILIDEK